RKRVDRLAHVEADAISFPDAERGQPVPHAIGERVELAIADRSCTRLDDRQRLRTPPRGADKTVVQAARCAHCASAGFFAMSSWTIRAIVSRFSRLTSCASKATPYSSSRKMTSLSAAMESRIP